MSLWRDIINHFGGQEGVVVGSHLNCKEARPSMSASTAGQNQK